MAPLFWPVAVHHVVEQEDVDVVRADFAAEMSVFISAVVEACFETFRRRLERSFRCGWCAGRRNQKLMPLSKAARIRLPTPPSPSFLVWLAAAAAVGAGAMAG